MKINLTKGILITLEGIDGSGKSSLAKALHSYLNEQHPTILTKEPGGSSLGKKLREITQHESISSVAEFLLFASDRAEHFEKLIIPALKENKIVISDRMADSSLAYQGYAKKLDVNMISMVNRWAMQNIEPDITIYTKVDAAIARERLSKRNLKLTKFEKEQEDFMITVSEAYDTIFKTRDNVITVDANKSEQAVLDETICRLSYLLNMKLGL